MQPGPAVLEDERDLVALLDAEGPANLNGNGDLSLARDSRDGLSHRPTLQRSSTCIPKYYHSPWSSTLCQNGLWPGRAHRLRRAPASSPRSRRGRGGGRYPARLISATLSRSSPTGLKPCSF